jgi:hypothetical protein
MGYYEVPDSGKIIKKEEIEQLNFTNSRSEEKYGEK